MGLKQVLKAYLNHRREVVNRRAAFRLDKIEKRLHLLDGYLIAFLNIDEVIRIIRQEDDPKLEMITPGSESPIFRLKPFSICVCALCAGSKKVEISKEHDKLSEERSEIIAMLGSERRQWTKVKKELRAAREVFDPSTELGRRRAVFAACTGD